ncbi:Outer membrane protein beta-barrel domain-containing protein [Vibrio xiamenensis]|uniref:Outer membrane protein beta-barrel domain-containing protein n=1 Tax=Vibrio xiamenensis TaxID=861298 RepID=A0A1G8GUE7_9VIBR|nr:outer membrane beta-barrel protein [Vibrio xiamenensis]SDH98024.1 Outer membrane protein beta-barrel domain-containing protein [Vibrio xiamenensis]
MRIAALMMLVISMSAAAQDVVTRNSRNLAIGFQSLSSTNTFELDTSSASADDDNDSTALALTLSYYTSKNIAFFLEYQSEEFDHGIYDNSNKKLTSLNVGFLREYPLGYGFTPYVQGAVGIGSIELDPSVYSNDSASTMNLKITAGMALYIAEAWRFHLGLSGQYRSWQSVDLGSGDIDISETSLIGVAGLGFRF